MPDIYLPITFDADEHAHIRNPHTTEEGAHEAARKLGADDPSIWRYEVHTLAVITDA